ncbi:MAG: NTPase [Deltaproteobacteria bacterium]|nr:NTPase [Deltaproteobacteria bacterium]
MGKTCLASNWMDGESRAHKNILITGRPGIGKTTLVRKIAKKAVSLNPAGFYTQEIREHGVREGLELISLEGRKGMLSHVRIISRFRVGKYAIDVKGFEDFLRTIPFFHSATELVIIDEIGKMECFSDTFTALIKEIFDSSKPVVATISLTGSGIIAEIKKRRDVTRFEVTSGNRDAIVAETLRLILRMG